MLCQNLDQLTHLRNDSRSLSHNFTIKKGGLCSALKIVFLLSIIEIVTAAFNQIKRRLLVQHGNQSPSGANAHAVVA